MKIHLEDKDEAWNESSGVSIEEYAYDDQPVSETSDVSKGTKRLVLYIYCLLLQKI